MMYLMGMQAEDEAWSRLSPEQKLDEAWAERDQLQRENDRLSAQLHEIKMKPTLEEAILFKEIFPGASQEVKDYYDERKRKAAKVSKTVTEILEENNYKKRNFALRNNF